jgi:hypothetical protein
MATLKQKKAKAAVDNARKWMAPQGYKSPTAMLTTKVKYPRTAKLVVRKQEKATSTSPYSKGRVPKTPKSSGYGWGH